MKEVIDSLVVKTKEAYKESVIIENDKLQDLLLNILTDSKKLQDLLEKEVAMNSSTDTKISTRYTYPQVKAITKIQVKLAKDEISLGTAEAEILKVSSTFPVQHLKQYNKRVQNYLNGIGEHGFAFPSNWAKALLEETNNSDLVIQAFRQQQELYLQKEGRINQKLESLLNSLKK